MTYSNDNRVISSDIMLPLHLEPTYREVVDGDIIIHERRIPPLLLVRTFGDYLFKIKESKYRENDGGYWCTLYIVVYYRGIELTNYAIESKYGKTTPGTYDKETERFNNFVKEKLDILEKFIARNN